MNVTLTIQEKLKARFYGVSTDYLLGLTEVEFEVMMRVLGKSRHLKSPGKKQGRKKRK